MFFDFAQHKQRGFSEVLVIILIAAVAVGAAYYLGRQTSPKSSPEPVVSSQTSVEYEVLENLVGDYNKITIKDKAGKVIVEDLVKNNEKEIGYNVKFRCQCGTSVKGWVDNSHFTIKIVNGGGEEYEYIVDASTGKVDESSFKQIIKIDETANWKTYTNSEVGFSFQYPSSLTRETYNAATALFIDKTQISPNQDSIRVDAILKKLDQYELVDNQGGFVFRFDPIRKEWVHKEDGSTSKFAPKRVEANTETYRYSTGDVKCSWDYIIMPHFSDPYFLEIINKVCGTDEVAPDKDKRDERTRRILSTFKFTQ